MKDFTFALTTKIHFGEKAHTHLEAEIKALTDKKVMLCYGGGSVKSNGVFDTVCSQLKAGGIEFVEFCGIKPNPELEKLREGIDICRKNDIGLMLAVGGGSVIDTAKGIAVGALLDGDIWDVFEKRIQATRALPVGVVLTLAAAGSEMSNSAVITNMKEHKKYGMGSELIRPAFSILNPNFTKSVDAYNTAAGVCDIYAHLHEQYFTTTKHVSSVDRMIEGLMISVIQNGYLVAENGEDYDARAEIMWAGCMAHNDVLTVGRDTDWASHRIEHELSAYYGLSHGAGLAVIMPAWMKYCYRYDIERFTSLAVNVLGAPLFVDDKAKTVQIGIRRLENFFKDIGLPTTLTQHNIDDTKFKLMANATTRNGTIDVGCTKVLNNDDIEKILYLAL